MGWLARLDARNQRVVNRQRRSADDAPDTTDDDNVGLAVGSYLSWLPGILGLAGAVVAIASVRRRRHHD